MYVIFSVATFFVIQTVCGFSYSVRAIVKDRVLYPNEDCAFVHHYMLHTGCNNPLIMTVHTVYQKRYIYI